MAEMHGADGTPLFSLQIDESGPRVILRLVGELDVSTAPRLQETLATIGSGEFAEIVLDLSDLSYLDSTGLSLFISTSKKARSSGRTLVLRNPQAGIRRLLEVTDLTGYFDVSEKAAD